MFGPLNPVRVTLVIAAGMAAVIAFFTGFALAGTILLAGVLVHGLGWIYLYGLRARDGKAEEA